MERITRVNSEFLDNLAAKSRDSPRRRAPMPLQAAEYTGPQFLVNAIQPDSYVHPHRHTYDEIWMGVRGRIILGLFDEDGTPRERIEFARDKVTFQVAPPNIYHFCFALEPDSVFMDARQGPFDPKAAKDLAPWAPREDADPAIIKSYSEQIRRAFLAL